MTNICTKVTVRKRPIKNGQVSLYLDFYPAIRHPKTGKPTRQELLTEKAIRKSVYTMKKQLMKKQNMLLNSLNY